MSSVFKNHSSIASRSDATPALEEAEPHRDLNLPRVRAGRIVSAPVRYNNQHVVSKRSSPDGGRSIDHSSSNHHRETPNGRCYKGRMISVFFIGMMLAILYCMRLNICEIFKSTLHHSMSTGCVHMASSTGPLPIKKSAMEKSVGYVCTIVSSCYSALFKTSSRPISANLYPFSLQNRALAATSTVTFSGPACERHVRSFREIVVMAYPLVRDSGFLHLSAELYSYLLKNRTNCPPVQINAPRPDGQYDTLSLVALAFNICVKYCSEDLQQYILSRGFFYGLLAGLLIGCFMGGAIVGLMVVWLPYYPLANKTLANKTLARNASRLHPAQLKKSKADRRACVRKLRDLQSIIGDCMLPYQRTKAISSAVVRDYLEKSMNLYRRMIAVVPCINDALLEGYMLYRRQMMAIRSAVVQDYLVESMNLYRLMRAVVVPRVDHALLVDCLQWYPQMRAFKQESAASSARSDEPLVISSATFLIAEKIPESGTAEACSPVSSGFEIVTLSTSNSSAVDAQDACKVPSCADSNLPALAEKDTNCKAPGANSPPSGHIPRRGRSQSLSEKRVSSRHGALRKRASSSPPEISILTFADDSSSSVSGDEDPQPEPTSAPTCGQPDGFAAPNGLAAPDGLAAPNGVNGFAPFLYFSGTGNGVFTYFTNHMDSYPPSSSNQWVASGDWAEGSRRGTQRIEYKKVLCKKYMSSDEKCQFGEKCHFAHGPSELQVRNWRRRLCQSWEREGKCPLEDRCCFAHGKSELIASDSDLPLNWRTELCKEWQQTKSCSHGELCLYAHGESELMVPAWRTRLCQKWREGKCPFGDRCWFAHGESELVVPDRPSNWRTKLCTEWQQTQSCSRGKLCLYAHGDSELSELIVPDRSPDWRTKLCKEWQKTQHCSYGKLCHFAHGECELIVPIRPHCRRTQLCKEWKRRRGTCSRGEVCPYAHGELELTVPKRPSRIPRRK